MITGVGKTWCQVDDMQRGIAFYRDVLGLKLRFDSPHWTEFEIDGWVVALHSRLAGEGPCGENGRGWYLGVTTDDVETLRSRVADGGGTDHGTHDVPGGIVLSFCDPDGNPIQAFQALG